LEKTIDISTLNREELLTVVDKLTLRTIELEHRLSVFEKMIFGPKHERFIPTIPVAENQLALGIEVEKAAEPEVVITQVPAHKRKKSEKKEKVHPGRHPLPASLPREEVIIEPLEDVTGCVCIGEEITEILEVTPASFYVKRIVRPKYVRANEEGIAIGGLPNRIIEKGIAGSSVHAMLIIEKFIDHLPVYRQQERFKRAGMDIKYNTMLDWINTSADWLVPLYELHKKALFESHYLQADETTMPVLDNEKKGSTHRGYIWAYRSSEKKLIFFEYQPGRGKAGPAALLKNFTGHLQTDGYGAYEQFILRKEIEVLYCMAHARRYFSEAVDNDKLRSEYVLSEIQKLYDIEREIKELTTEEKYEIRQQQSVQILKGLGSWMIEQHPEVTPKSAIGKALEYSMKRWVGLSRYTTDGKLMIDNNLIENNIRPIALGRKNYLFAGTHEAAQRIAMIYSLLGTCKLHDINPQEWLTKVFEEIPNRNVNNVEDLLPQNFKSNM
jgi:transposase